MSDSSDRPSQREWNRLRRQALDRDEYSCQSCGTDVDTGPVLSGASRAEIHHKKAVANGGGHELRNLVTLCEDCHKDAHGRNTLRDVLDAVDAVAGPAVLTSEIADQLDCETETAGKKLDRLHRLGVLGHKKVARRNIYWPLEEDDNDA